MTSPGDPKSDSMGEVERVPLKVVPIYVQPIEDEPERPEEEDDLVEEDGPESRSRPAWLGIAAAVLALATVGVHVSALVIATGGDFPAGTLLGYLAIGLSVLAAVVGVIAAILGMGRAWGIGAAIVAVLANPWLLLVVLQFLAGLQTG